MTTSYRSNISGSGPAAPVKRDPLEIHAAAVIASLETRPLDRVGGWTHCVDEQGNAYPIEVPTLPLAPARPFGSYQFDDVRDFARWVRARGVGRASLWAEKGRITAVINDLAPFGSPEADEAVAGWADLRATLTMRHTPAWDRWSKVNRQFVSQDAFADLIELGIAEIVDPPASLLIDLVNDFHATAETTFTSAMDDSTGTARLAWTDLVDGRSRTGEIIAPTKLTLFLAVYEGTEPMRVEVRFRFRLDRATKKVSFGVVFPRSNDEYARDAIAAASGQIVEICGIEPYAGQPPAPRC